MTVRAHNINGAGPESNRLVLIERVEPRAPVLSADWGDESVDLTWNTPFNGGSIITQYILYKQLPGETEWSELARTQGNSYDDLMVENGQTYAYRVRAVNAIGEGDLSNVVRDTPRTVPSAPEVYILNPGDKTLFASWTAPDNDGGGPVDQFSVYVGSVLYADTNGTDLTITGLTNGITYSVTVRAHNSVGLGPASEPMEAKPVGLPGTPQDLSAEAVPNRVTLTWTAPSEGGGAGPVQYRIYEGKAGRSDLISIGTTTQTSFVLDMGMDDISVRYDYRVEAFNTLGVGGNATILDVTPSVVYITGKVVDDEGSPVAHATVQVQGGDQASSDQEGTFYVLAEPGPRVLWINGTGFESADLQVQVGTSPSQLGSVTLTSAQTDGPTEGIDPLIVVIPLVLVGALVAAFLVLRRRR
jgi:titin